jgi:hypothetical protein
MKYIAITEVDAVTKISCTVEPQRNGPSMPDIKGLALDWADMSTWPVEINQDGTYKRAPLYYGTCDDDANTDVLGFIEELTHQEWFFKKHNEFFARRPHESWIWNPETLVWSSPVPYPQNAAPYEYIWKDSSRSWVKNLALQKIS